MKQSSSLTRHLADAQDHAVSKRELDSYLKIRPGIPTELRASDFTHGPKEHYRVYTEDVNRSETVEIVRRYFPGATLVYGLGLDARTQANDEPCVAIDIVTSRADGLQHVINMAGDIRQHNRQISVLITHETVNTFEVVSPETLPDVDELTRSITTFGTLHGV